MKIHLKEGAVPFAIHSPRQIPFAFHQQAKEELKFMVRQRITEPAGDEPFAWCHPLVVVAKDKGVRITVDLTKLNSQVSRPAHSAPSLLVHNSGHPVWLLEVGAGQKESAPHDVHYPVRPIHVLQRTNRFRGYG